jgi:hypothetical protein
MVGQISGVLRRSGEKDRSLLIFMIEDFLDRALKAARLALDETAAAPYAGCDEEAA